MKVLFLAAEVAPFSKSGGLGDVAGALPAALASLGEDVVVATPLYGAVKDRRILPLEKTVRLKFPFGEETAALHEAKLGQRHRVLFLDHPGYFGRAGYYEEGGVDYPDNARRFAFFSVGALQAAQQVGFLPDVVHLNDWHTGLAAVALRRGFGGTGLGSAKVVFTIHNLAYQGVFDKEAMNELGLPWDLFVSIGLEFYDRLNFLKAGVAFADRVTTVSKKYALEIQTPEYGFGLDGFLGQQKAKLHGILNGVDYGEWSPDVDPYLKHRYSARNLSGKRRCKADLLRKFGLPFGEKELGLPLFCLVGRLAEQKGIDLVLSVLPRLLEKEARLVLLGSGDERYEEALRQAQRAHPTRMGVKIGFDHPLAHLVEAGSDFFLMPSRFEPCGLNQMYSLRYGTLPIVRATGGLDDTVVDAALPEGNGFKFEEYSPRALSWALDRALAVYQDGAKLAAMRRRAMDQHFGWDRAAKEYMALYRQLARSKGRT